MGSAEFHVMRKPTMSAVKNFSELSAILSKLEISGVYLFIGNGAKLQYGNMEQVRASLQPVLNSISNQHGGSRGWMAVYGGDTYDPANPCLGSCMHYVKTQFSPYILSVQGWPEVDNFVDFVLKYEEQRDQKGNIVYGGVLDNKTLLGGTSIYLGEDFRSILSGVVNISARGRIGTVELDFARHVGLNVIDVSPADAAREYN